MSGAGEDGMNQLLEAVLLGVKQLTPDNLKVTYSFIRKMQPNKEAQNRVDELAWNSGMVCTADSSKFCEKSVEEALIKYEIAEKVSERFKELKEIAKRSAEEKQFVASAILLLLRGLSADEPEGWILSIAETIANVMENDEHPDDENYYDDDCDWDPEEDEIQQLRKEISDLQEQVEHLQAQLDYEK